MKKNVEVLRTGLARAKEDKRVMYQVRLREKSQDATYHKDWMKKEINI